MLTHPVIAIGTAYAATYLIHTFHTQRKENKIVDG